MAMALEKQPLKAENLEKFQKLNEASKAFIKEALTLEESNSQSMALLHYEEGLRLLDQALALDLPNDISNVIPDDCDKEIIKVHKTRINLSRTRQQVVFRIHELKSKLQSETSPTPTPSAPPPPSYEESVQNSLENALNKDLNSSTSTATIDNEENHSTITLPSDAEILFTIAGQVQIFYINKDGNVSAPSYPSSLFIFKFKTSSTTPTSVSADDSTSFLKVGDWVYPLVKGKSPILKSNEGAYLFPDLDENVEGNAIGLILPKDILDVEKEQLENILQKLTQNEDLKQYDDCLEYSSQISSGLIMGAEMVGKGMVKGAIKSSEWMYIGASKLKNHINPENEPRQVNPKLKATLGAAKWVTSHTVKASGYLVSKAGAATVALGQFLAPHIKNHSTKALSHIIEQSDEKSQKQLNIASELASGTVTALSTVYMGLENSSRILAHHVSNNTVELVSHKYGREMGSATENALSTVGNSYLTAYNAAALGPKSLAKRAAKTTGKVAVGVSEDVIMGAAPSVRNEDRTDDKAIEHKRD